MAIWLAQLSVDRWRLSKGLERGQGADGAPLALIADTAHGPRLEAVNHAAREAGLHGGMMLADARTLCPDIAVHPADPAGDLEALEKLTLWAQRWGPWSALDPPDGLIVDVTAVAHLFGGEGRLLEDVAQHFVARDLTVRTAIAPTAGAAWALAHYGRHNGVNGAILSPENDMAARLADLPVAALRIDTDVLTVLRRLGLKRLGDLDRIEGAQATGRDALQRRFRKGAKGNTSPASNPLVRMDQLLGRVPEPLVPIVPQNMPLVQRRLAEPIRHRTLLDTVLSDLTEQMARMLEGRGEGARRLELGLWRVDGEVIVRRLEMAAASRDPAHILRLFANRLENIDAGFGIESVRLRASWTEPSEIEQSDIETGNGPYDQMSDRGTSLAACVDRLSVRLGAQAVSKPMPHLSHIPERAQHWSAPLTRLPPHHNIPNTHKRPLKLYDNAEKISVIYASPDGHPQRFQWRGETYDVARVEGPERFAPEWWRERSKVRLRDYYQIEDSVGRRYWVFRDGLAGDGRGGAPNWFLHGLFG